MHLNILCPFYVSYLQGVINNNRSLVTPSPLPFSARPPSVSHTFFNNIDFTKDVTMSNNTPVHVEAAENIPDDLPSQSTQKRKSVRPYNYYVAQIEALWENTSGEGFMRICWLYWPDETARG